jgi:PAS domain S-box-containing protein
MKNTLSSQSRRYRLIAAGTAAVAIIVGALVFIGWRLRIPVLTSLVPGLVVLLVSVICACAFWLNRANIARRHAEERDRELAALVDSSSDAIIGKTLDGTITSWNKGAERVYGYRQEEVLGKNIALLVPPALIDDVPRFLNNIRKGTPTEGFETIRRRKDGTLIHVSLTISPVRNRDGIITGASTVARDITDRKRAEERLSASQAQLGSIIDSAMDAMVTVDSQQQIVMFNPAAEKMFGCSAADALGSPLDRFIPERFRAAHGKHIQTFGKTGVTSRAMGALGALKGLRANGEEFPIEASISQTVSSGNKLYTAIVRDVTERERIDRALREQASVLDLAQVLVRDMDDRIVLWNRGAEKLYGFTLEEATGRTSHELLHTELPEPLEVINEKLRRTGEWEGELVHRKRDGSRIVVASVWTLERDANGQPSRILEANTDITARKRAEEALQLAQARLLSALEGGRMGTWVWDISTNQIVWDDAMVTLVGRNPEELAGSIEPFFSGLHPQDRERTRTTLERALQDGTQYESEYRLLRPDQSMVWIAARGRVERDAQGKAFRMTGVCIDITDRRKVEEQLLQSQKMQALGTLAGGIAHDFNNILLAIGGNVSLAMEDLPPDHPAQTSLREIGKAGARASGLVRQILSFSRRQAPDRKPIDVKSVVEEALALLRATLPARITIRASFAADLPSISADSTQLHQVILNLGTNAARAMGEQGGLLDVTAKAVTVSADLAAQTKVKEGHYLRLSISDTGCGMDRHTLDRIFEPFFTTQAPGQGTGLGLSVVHGIMKDHDGSVSVYSDLGKGTIFHLYFPVVREVLANEPASAAPTRGHGQRLLYVDDEESLVFLATRSLERLGYKVIGETDPACALQLFRQNPAQFDAVITDLSMPGLSGSELARQMMEVRPDIPIVMMSGYIRPEDEREARRLGIRDLILKPDTIEDLAQALNRLFVANAAGPAAVPGPATK